MTLLSAIIRHRPEQITADDLAEAAPDDLLAAIAGVDEVLRSPTLAGDMTVGDARRMVNAMGELAELLELAHHMAEGSEPPEVRAQEWRAAAQRAAEAIKKYQPS
ncbi:MAG: hypothetical protein AB7D07_10320 [Desulfovibrionaceae bacterium]